MLAKVCLEGVNTRFEDVINEKSTILSSISHPKFKFRCLNTPEKEETKELLQLEIELHSNINTDSNISIQVPVIEEENVDDSFLFEIDEQPNAELERFLNTHYNGDLKCLNIVPTIKQIFLKYNTALPSSASAERLFSIAGDICSKKRARLSDTNFESSLLFKMNYNLFHKK